MRLTLRDLGSSNIVQRIDIDVAHFATFLNSFTSAHLILSQPLDEYFLLESLSVNTSVSPRSSLRSRSRFADYAATRIGVAARRAYSGIIRFAASRAQIINCSTASFNYSLLLIY